MPMAKLLKLTKREKGFVRDIANGKTGVAAATRNYNTSSYSSAGAIASETLDKPRIQEALKAIGNQIPDELLVERHLELLNQRKLSYIYDENNNNQIRVVDQPDYMTVLRALDLAYRIKGVYKDKPQSAITGNSITFTDFSNGTENK